MKKLSTVFESFTEEQLKKNPKIHKYGRPPLPCVYVKQEYVKDAKILLNAITDYIKNERIDLSVGPPDLRNVLTNGVLEEASQEYKMFRANLDEIIA